MCVIAALAITSPRAARAADAVTDPAEQLDTLPGFKVELVLKADKKVNGSWISSPRTQGPPAARRAARPAVTRVTIKDGKVEKQEDLKLPVSETMGIALGVRQPLRRRRRQGTATARRSSASAPARYHGRRHSSTRSSSSANGRAAPASTAPHGIVLGPDKKLYIVCGNFVGLPDGSAADLARTSNYADDRVLPRAEDGNGFGAGKKPPGGFICRMDQDGKNAELFASGQRNTYDIAFNADGELFGFDSDMEWDWGMPWYRPIRVFHAVSGGDTGFREGTAKWPEYYADSLPPVVNIGIGCPTGVVFGYGRQVPGEVPEGVLHPRLDATAG